MLVQIIWITFITICFATPTAISSSDLEHADDQESFFAVAVCASFPMYLVISLSRFLKGGTVTDLRTSLCTILNGFLLCVYVVMFSYAVWSDLPDDDKKWQFLIPFIIASVLEFWYLSVSNYVPIEINKDFKDVPTIGEIWANSCSKYYMETFTDLQKRMKNFEIKQKELGNGSFTLKLKKMVILIPLSCDARGTLKERDSNFEYHGILDIHRCVQGANINREYKNPIYKVTSVDGNHCLYVSIEEPNTLMALWILKESVPEGIWEFQRNEFISTLSYNLKDQPCVILQYDDRKMGGPVMPLSDFVIEEVNNL